MSKTRQQPKVMDMKMKQYRLLVQGRRVHLAALLSCCLLASCGGSDDLPSENAGTDTTPIGFSSTISPQEKAQTRTGVVTDISNMYVFASYTGTADWKTTDTPNFMYKQLMTKNGTNWTYTPLKYWPNAADERISFFAYAPTVTGVVLSENNAEGPKLTYTVPTNENGKQDFLLGAVMNRTKSNNMVSFKMKHALTQIKFCVKSGDTGTTKKLKGLTVSAPQQGTASFDTGGNLQWTIESAHAPFVAENKSFADNGLDIPATSTDKTDVVATFFLLPVDNPFAREVTVSLTYTLQKTGEDAQELTAATRIPASTLWSPGSNIIYTLSIVDDRLEISNVIVEGFGGGESVGEDIPAT